MKLMMEAAAANSGRGPAPTATAAEGNEDPTGDLTTTEGNGKEVFVTSPPENAAMDEGAQVTEGENGGAVVEKRNSDSEVVVNIEGGMSTGDKTGVQPEECQAGIASDTSVGAGKGHASPSDSTYSEHYHPAPSGEGDDDGTLVTDGHTETRPETTDMDSVNGMESVLGINSVSGVIDDPFSALEDEEDITQDNDEDEDEDGSVLMVPVEKGDTTRSSHTGAVNAENEVVSKEDPLKVQFDLPEQNVTNQENIGIA